jgi:molybdopterin synthase catalytic subunit
MMFCINPSPIDCQKLERALVNSRAGALVAFSGWVRNHNEGENVSTLEYECYEAMAENEAAKIFAEAKTKFDILEVSCEHRVGLLSVGEVAVWVGVTAVHRDDAFAACRFVIDQIKLRLPIWKRETYQDGRSEWVNCKAHEHKRGQNDAAKNMSEDAILKSMTANQ